MDWVFNNFVPDSTPECVIVPPSGKTFITGMASQFDDEYDDRLMSGRLERSKFREIIHNINDILFSYWPCSTCWWIGYVCWLWTLGLSFILPSICVWEAKGKVRKAIAVYNDKMLRRRGITLGTNFNYILALRISKGTSWLEFNIDIKYIPILTYSADVSDRENLMHTFRYDTKVE